MKHMTDEIGKLLSGELDAGRVEMVHRHCRDCEACASALRESTAVWNLLESDTAPDPSRPVWFALRERRRTGPGRLIRLTYATASVAVALVGVMMGLQMGGPAAAGADEFQGPEYFTQGTLFTEDTSLDVSFSLDTVSEGEEYR